MVFTFHCFSKALRSRLPQHLRVEFFNGQVFSISMRAEFRSAAQCDSVSNNNRNPPQQSPEGMTGKDSPRQTADVTVIAPHFVRTW